MYLYFINSAFLANRNYVGAIDGAAARRFGWKAHYVAHYKDQEFILKPVYFGLELSLTCAFRICGEYLRDQLMQRRAA